MPFVYITEYALTGSDRGGKPTQAAREPRVAEQRISLGVAAALSQPLHPATALVRVYSDAACHIVFGTDPTATTSSAKLAADAPEYFGVRSGGVLRLSAIAA